MPEPLKSDWWCVAVDETRNYNIADDDKPLIEKILGVYIYNRAERTHCCELTPSYALLHVYDTVWCRDAASDDQRGDLDQKYAHEASDDCYMWCSDVERIPGQVQYGEVEGIEDCNPDPEKRRRVEEDVVREHYQGDCPF